MKLGKIHLFLILLCALIFSTCLGAFVREGFETENKPLGVKQSDIPEGDEDLYILKTQVVPPVCPVCPSVSSTNSSSDTSKCPPCPACERCPEPSFECKKVPNYSSVNNNTLPRPLVSDFSSFGA